MLLNIIFSFLLLSLNSCTIEGEEICGLWNVDNYYGEMQIEITPWKTKFYGYLLSYKNDNETIVGNKTDEFIFITDLEYKDAKYQNGKIYVEPNSKTYCGLTLKLIDKNKLKAIYDCDGQISEEFWYREGHAILQETVQKTLPTSTETEEPLVEKIAKEATQISATPAKKRNNTTAESTPALTKSSSPKIEGETQRQSSFYIIGIQEVVEYNDYKSMEKAIETVWTKVYNDDFSPKLSNITESDKMYLSYSNYDNPKGKMTITLGYKVENLSNLPVDLQGVKVPTNNYLVYLMSGDKSDFEGEGWEQLNELMTYRNANSADYEVYTFDKDYNISNAQMWIATE